MPAYPADRLTVVAALEAQGICPVFYHPEVEACLGIIRSAARAGARVIEFTDRGDHAADLFAELSKTLARTDLTDTQRASMLYQRGVARGAWIGEWPEAYPQCATGDYLAMLEIAPDHDFAEKAVEQIEYQTGRSIYFDQEPFLGAPEACDAYHQQGLEYLESRQ